MTVTAVQGCTVAIVATASGYRTVTLERNSIGDYGVAIVTTAQINRVGVIVTAGCGESATTANYDIVVVLKASVVVIVVDYDASVASGTAAADCTTVLIGVTRSNNVMLLGQLLLQD